MASIPHIDGPTLRRLLPPTDLVDALADAFREGTLVPERISLAHDGGRTLVMPAVHEGEAAGVKLVTVRPENPARGIPSIQGLYVFFDGPTGSPRATLDAPALTQLRTAAASALASRILSRPDTGTMAMLGAGALAPWLIRAHAAVRPIRRVRVWNRTAARARALADQMRRDGLDAAAYEDAEAAVQGADLICSATYARSPILKRAWLSAGSHVDLVGAFTPAMCEAEPDVFEDAQVWVDTLEGARSEAGDLIQAVAADAFDWGSVQGTLVDAVRASGPVRTSAQQRTVFKSVGTALEDLAAARLAWSRFDGQ